MISKTHKAGIAAALSLALLAPPAHAGLLQAIDTAMKNYAENIVEQGETGINDIKNGSVKNLFDSAWKNYAASFHEEGKLGGDALKDTKAIFGELKKIAMWVPNQIKKIWNKIIDGLGGIRDKIDAAGPGWPPPNAGGAPAASESADESAEELPSIDEIASEGDVRMSAGLGDGFLGKFHTARNFDRKFEVYREYMIHAARTKAWLGKQDPKVQSEISPKVEKILGEVGSMEELMVAAAAGRDFDSFVAAAGRTDKSTAQVIFPGLMKRLTKKVNMTYLGNKGDEEASRKVKALADLKAKLGLS